MGIPGIPGTEDLARALLLLMRFSFSCKLHFTAGLEAARVSLAALGRPLSPCRHRAGKSIGAVLTQQCKK